MAYKIGWTVLWVASASIGLVGCAETQLWPGAPIGGADKSAADNADLDAASRLDFLRPANEQEGSRLSLARLSERRGQGHLAHQIYAKVASENPSSVVAHHRLGVLAAREGKLDQAAEHFERASHLAPPTAELLSDMGYCYYLQNRIEEAETTLTAALKLEPNHAAAANNLAMVLGEQRRFDECLAAFQRAGTEAQAHANIAYIYAQLGEYAKAQTHYGRALSIDPEMRTAASAMLQIAERQRGQSYQKPAPPTTQAAPATTEKSNDKLTQRPATSDAAKLSKRQLQTANLATLHAAASTTPGEDAVTTTPSAVAKNVANVQHVEPSSVNEPSAQPAAIPTSVPPKITATPSDSVATPPRAPSIKTSAPAVARPAVVVVEPKRAPVITNVTPAPVSTAPIVSMPTASLPAEVTSDGMISVYDRAGAVLPAPSQAKAAKPARPAAVQSASRRGQIMTRGAETRPMQPIPGRSPQARGNLPANAMPMQTAPLSNAAPSNEEILRAAFQQRLDAVNTSAGTYLPLNKPATKK